MDTHRTGDLQIDQDPDAQRHHWIAERVGWTVITLVILAALLGLFGSGWLSEASVGTPEGALRLEYSRFGRFLAPTTLRLHLGPDVIHEGRVSLWLNRDYIEAAQVQRILPSPDAVEAGADRLTYVLRVSDTGRPTTVTIHLEPDRVGSLSGQIGVAGHKPLRFDQFIYP